MNAIITVIGSDRPGIIAQVSGLLYEHNINILDISQTILSGYFTMVMLVDLAGMDISFQQMLERLASLEAALGTQIRMQRSELFDAMHRV